MKYLFLLTILASLSLGCSRSPKRSSKHHPTISPSISTEVEAEAPTINSDNQDKQKNQTDLKEQLESAEMGLKAVSNISFSAIPETDEILTLLPTGWFRFDRSMTEEQNQQIAEADQQLNQFALSAISYLDQKTDQPISNAKVIAKKLHMAKQIQAFLKLRPEIDELIKTKTKLSRSINSFNIAYHGFGESRTKTADMELNNEVLEMSAEEAQKIKNTLEHFIEIAEKLTKKEILFHEKFSQNETIGQKISDLLPYAKEVKITADTISNGISRDLLAELKSIEEEGIALNSTSEVIDLGKYPVLNESERISPESSEKLKDLSIRLNQASDKLLVSNEKHTLDPSYKIMADNANHLAALIEFKRNVLNYEQAKDIYLASESPSEDDQIELSNLLEQIVTQYQTDSLQAALDNQEHKITYDEIFKKQDYEHWLAENRYFIDHLQ